MTATYYSLFEFVFIITLPLLTACCVNRTTLYTVVKKYYFGHLGGIIINNTE